MSDIKTGQTLNYALVYFMGIEKRRDIIKEKGWGKDVEIMIDDLWFTTPLQLKQMKMEEEYRKRGITNWQRAFFSWIGERVKSTSVEQFVLEKLKSFKGYTFNDLWTLAESLKTQKTIDEDALGPLRAELKMQIITEVHFLVGVHMRLLKKFKIKRDSIKVVKDGDRDNGEE